MKDFSDFENSIQENMGGLLAEAEMIKAHVEKESTGLATEKGKQTTISSFLTLRILRLYHEWAQSQDQD